MNIHTIMLHKRYFGTYVMHVSIIQ